MPTEAIISVTNRCDAKCVMCNIWKLDRAELLDAEDYRRCTPKSLRKVNVTGGEALLRSDIVEIMHAIYEACGAQIIVATNGFRTEQTLKRIGEIRRHVPELGVAVSLDGCAATHDRMRGVPSAFKRAIATLKALQDAGVQDLRIGFTATPSNVNEVTDVYGLAESLGVQFAATIAQNSDVYYSTGSNMSIDAQSVEKSFGELIRRRLASRSPKNWIRAYFDGGVIHFAKTGNRQTVCDAASAFFYLSPSGDVYPCLTLNTPMGNVRRNSFAEIWYGAPAASVRPEVNGCRKCWMVCTARTQIKRQPIAVASWLIAEHSKAAAARLRNIHL
jgi:MoaA/NifB/PqqE/SkfB family radical SAM enzyme